MHSIEAQSAEVLQSLCSLVQNGDHYRCLGRHKSMPAKDIQLDG